MTRSGISSPDEFLVKSMLTWLCRTECDAVHDCARRQRRRWQYSRMRCTGSDYNDRSFTARSRL